MVIMALDHVRDFFHKEAFTDDPMNMDTTTPWLFFTRFITHFCAPTFVFLAGTSAFLMGQKKTKAQLSKFLITRGLWLVFAELAIITLGWTFNPLYNLFILQVIWAIGISMIILGILIWLPLPVIFIIGLLIVAGHNLLDYPEAERKHEVGMWWNIVHHAQFYFVPFGPDRGALVVYAFLPWTGIMALGYCFGTWYRSSVPAAVRRKRLYLLGFGLIFLFVVLRLINQYGNPWPWTEQSRGALYSFFSFLNVNKYPPSLMFTCMTLGPSILFLALFDKIKVGVNHFFLTFGRVPFFYYILHFFIIHTICVIFFFADNYGTGQIVDRRTPFLFRPLEFGYNLWVVYGVWITVVLILYPLCRWYNKYKSTHQQWWLSYL